MENAKLVHFEPKEDITAYELALIVRIIHRAELADQLPDCAKRHIRIEEIKQEESLFSRLVHRN